MAATPFCAAGTRFRPPVTAMYAEPSLLLISIAAGT